MEENKPIFSFKKVATKKIGDFDVNDKSEWTLLIKPQYQDVTLFTHMRKLWNVIELPAVVDADGNEEKPAVKAHPAWEHRSGFIKDDKFVTTHTKMISDQTYHGIHKRYILNIQNLLDQGYTKDYNNYVGDVPNVPHYYINERTSEEDIRLQQIAYNVRQVVGGQQTPQPQQQGNPHVQIIPKKTGLFSGILRKAVATPAVEEKDDEEEEEESPF